MGAVVYSDDLYYLPPDLDETTRQYIRYRTREIRVLAKRAARDIVVIGQRLLEVKAALPHGSFGPWLQAEFNWTDRTARNFMRVAQRFKMETVSDLNISPTALYLLASGDVPDVVVDDAFDLAATARAPLSEAQVREILDRHNGVTRDETETRGRKPDEAREAIENATACLLGIMRLPELVYRDGIKTEAQRERLREIIQLAREAREYHAAATRALGYATT